MAESFDDILKDMLEKAKVRDARPCNLLYHDTEPRHPDKPFYGTWIFEAPYAHPLWHQYVVVVFDLTTPLDHGDTVMYKPNMTHEVWCFALDPTDPFVTPPPGTRYADLNLKRLIPPNFGYQFPAATDGDALQRIDKLVMSFIRKEVSPDTDFRRLHDHLFADGVICSKGMTN